MPPHCLQALGAARHQWNRSHDWERERSTHVRDTPKALVEQLEKHSHGDSERQAGGSPPEIDEATVRAERCLWALLLSWFWRLVPGRLC